MSFFYFLASWGDFKSNVFLNIDALRGLFLQLPECIKYFEEQNLNGSGERETSALDDLNAMAETSDILRLEHLEDINNMLSTPGSPQLTKGTKRKIVEEEEEEEMSSDEEEEEDIVMPK